MITPAFDLSQDPEYLILNIRVPYTRTSEFDLYIDGTDFKFYAKPYFLRWVDQHTHTDVFCFKDKVKPKSDMISVVVQRSGRGKREQLLTLDYLCIVCIMFLHCYWL